MIPLQVKILGSTEQRVQFQVLESGMVLSVSPHFFNKRVDLGIYKIDSN